MIVGVKLNLAELSKLLAYADRRKLKWDGSCMQASQ